MARDNRTDTRWNEHMKKGKRGSGGVPGPRAPPRARSPPCPTAESDVGRLILEISSTTLELTFQSKRFCSVGHHVQVCSSDCCSPHSNRPARQRPSALEPAVLRAPDSEASGGTCLIGAMPKGSKRKRKKDRHNRSGKVQVGAASVRPLGRKLAGHTDIGHGTHVGSHSTTVIVTANGTTTTTTGSRSSDGGGERAGKQRKIEQGHEQQPLTSTVPPTLERTRNDGAPADKTALTYMPVANGNSGKHALPDGRANGGSGDAAAASDAGSAVKVQGIGYWDSMAKRYDREIYDSCNDGACVNAMPPPSHSSWIPLFLCPLDLTTTSPPTYHLLSPHLTSALLPPHLTSPRTTHPPHVTSRHLTPHHLDVHLHLHSFVSLRPRTALNKELVTRLLDAAADPTHRCVDFGCGVGK
jgi:hypothetical protein